VIFFFFVGELGEMTGVGHFIGQSLANARQRARSLSSNSKGAIIGVDLSLLTKEKNPERFRKVAQPR
jgi:hypothetical protein